MSTKQLLQILLKSREGIRSGTSNLDEFVGIKKQDFASGGLAAMLGE